MEEIYIEDDYKRKQYLDTNMWRLSTFDGVVNENIILRWVNRVTGYNHITIKPSLVIFLLATVIIFVMLIVFVMLYVYCNKIILNEKLWLFCCLVVFFILGGGYYYTKSKKVPFIGKTKEGMPEFIKLRSRA